jgi:hypothetical protein
MQSKKFSRRVLCVWTRYAGAMNASIDHISLKQNNMKNFGFDKAKIQAITSDKSLCRAYVDRRAFQQTAGRRIFPPRRQRFFPFPQNPPPKKALASVPAVARSTIS